MLNFAFKFQAVAEKTAKKILGGYFILPHPVESESNSNSISSSSYNQQPARTNIVKNY